MMMRTPVALAIWLFSAACLATQQGPSDADPAASKSSDLPESVLDVQVATIEGEQTTLSQYRGKVLLLVNTASHCGYTPQYEGLESLYRKHKESGFVVLGFPCNDFGGQEPGSEEQIKSFCTDRYDVTFPLFSKVSITGKEPHQLYHLLQSLEEPLGGPVRWNFTKFLVDREGRVVARFESAVKPDDPKLAASIEALIEQKAAPAAGSPDGGKDGVDAPPGGESGPNADPPQTDRPAQDPEEP